MNRRMRWAIVFMLCLCVAGLAACGSDNASGQAASDGSDASQAQAGSMRAVHDDPAWESIEADPSKKTCLSCHPRSTITAATEDYLGQEGMNPHASHTESYDCQKCHSMTGMSVLVCNTACHGGYHGDGEGWKLPNENWQNPTEELPSADGEGIPVNL